jgi:hypothetical protein
MSQQAALSLQTSVHERIAEGCPPPDPNAPYCLEIYSSRYATEPLARFFSSRPFPAFHAGDFLRDATLRPDGWPMDPPRSIARVEHVIWLVPVTGEVRSKLVVYLRGK